MMGNCILVPAYKRPAFLWLCLESLRKCRGIENYHVCIAFKGDADPAIPDVARELLSGLNFELKEMPSEWLSLRNYGEDLKYAFSKSDDFVIVVEEDQEVSKDFLEVIEYVASNFREERLFGACASCATPGGTFFPADNELLWLVRRFHFRGYVIFKEQFERFLSPYLCEEFYQSESLTRDGEHAYNYSFMDAAFPELKDENPSLDGLVDKMIKHLGLWSLILVVPRCHCTGFYGLHTRGITAEGVKFFRSQPLQTQVDFLKSAIQAGALKDFFGQFTGDYWDIEDDHVWSRLRVRSEGMY